MEINSLYEALGIASPVDTSAEPEQESAAPAAAQTDSGDTEQEPAAPASEEVVENEPAEEDDTDGGDGKGGKQSKAENRKQARLRREREKQEAVDAAINAERERISELLKAARIPDPQRRGEQLGNVDRITELSSEQAAKDISEKLKKGEELTREEITALLNQSEVGREMITAIDRAQAAENEAKFEQVKLMQDRQVKLISQIDPSIKTFEDITAMPEYEAFAAYVKDNNLSWSDAYRLAAAERLGAKSAAAERQRTINSVTGKSHMSQDGGRGGDGVDMPGSVEDGYRLVDPSLTHEQCLKKYADYLRRTKKG